MYTLTSPSQQAELADYIARAKSKLGPEVEHVAYRIREDSSGELGIFFRITLIDSATAEDVISEVSGRVVMSLLEDIDPVANWGLRPYFNFRSQTEQSERPDPDWV